MNDRGEYIEPVPEEKGDQSFIDTDGSYVSLDDLGGGKQVTEEDEQGVNCEERKQANDDLEEAREDSKDDQCYNKKQSTECSNTYQALQ